MKLFTVQEQYVFTASCYLTEMIPLHSGGSTVLSFKKWRENKAVVLSQYLQFSFQKLDLKQFVAFLFSDREVFWFINVLLWWCGSRAVIEGLWLRFQGEQVEVCVRREQRRRILQTLVWFVITLVLALFIPDIGRVISLIGGLAACFIFVFPGKTALNEFAAFSRFCI